MSGRPRVITDPRQLAFEFVEPFKYEWSLVGETPTGYGMFRRENEAGGWVYMTDQYGVGYMAYDSAITDVVSLFSCMVHEDRDNAERMWQHIGAVFDFKK